MKNNYDTNVCIVGLGPAGMGAALTLANSKIALDVLCLDAGASIDTRHCSILQDHDCKKEEICQIISGVGGYSLLSGGKISMLPAGSNLIAILGSRKIAERELIKSLTLFDNYISLEKPKILNDDIKNASRLFEDLGFEFRYYDAYLFNPEDLRKGYQRMLSEIDSKRIQILLNTKVVQIYPHEGGFKLIAVQNEQEITIFTEKLVIGVGRLGRDLLRSLNTKLNLEGTENYLDVGVRLEFPTELYPEIDKYHNDLKLLFGDARTFCVCKDGKIAPYLYDGICFTEGYRDYTHKTGFTNLAITIRLKPSSQNEMIICDIKKRVIKISKGRPICQNLSDFLNLTTGNNSSIKSSIAYWIKGNVNKCFPEPLSTKIREVVHYFVSKSLPKEHWGKVNVFAPELDYSGLSFPIKSDFSIAPDLYLIGDCTGKFRGILQSFCSGIICAENIIGGGHGKNL